VPQQRDYLVLRYLQGLTAGQTARELSLSGREASNLRTRALSALASQLPDDFASSDGQWKLVGADRLRGRQREIYELRVAEGKSTHEIARDTGLSPATVRVHLLRAKRALEKSPLSPPRASEPKTRRRTVDLSTVDTSQTNLMKLPVRQRQVVRMAKVGISAPKIAAELGIAPSTVRVYLSKAMRKLGSVDQERNDNGAASSRTRG